MRKKLKIGIIGSNFGVIGLAPAFSSLKNCEVAAICAKKSKRLDSYLDHAGSKKIYSDWRLLLEHEGLDAVAIAVTPKAQFRIVKAAIAKGLNVFAEKPFATNIRQARELLTLAKKKKITHGIDFMFPEIAEWQKVKELLDSKALGALKHISVNWDWLSRDFKYNKSTWRTSVSEGGGVLSFYFSHGLHYLEHFAGRIEHTSSLFAYSSRSANDGEVCIDMLLKFSGGVTGQAHASCVSMGMIKHQLVFQCEQGVIVLENKNAVVDGFSVRIYNQEGVKQLRVIPDKNLGNDDERVKIVKKLASRFVSACINKSQMNPSFEEGLRVQELIAKVRAETS